MSLSARELEEHEQYRIDYLIENGEAVQYGERWTEKTTYEWWLDESGKRHCRQVMAYHGGGNRGDDDEAEYVRRLLDMGRARYAREFDTDVSDEELLAQVPEEVTHLVKHNGTMVRIRYYVPPPESLGGQ